MSTRPYEQRKRAEAAEETRRRIVDAVIERLEEAPTDPVSVERIARMAGVARSTVYAIFGTRRGLFWEVLREISERGGYARLVEAKRHPDAREHLRAALRAATEMNASRRDVTRALYSMAQLDEDAAGDAIRRIEEERANGLARLAGRLGEQGKLRPDVTVDEATHILWMITSFESFDLLYTGRGLTVDETTDLLVATAERAVCR